MTEADSPRQSPAHADDTYKAPATATDCFDDWRLAFLEKLGETSNVTQAARAASISPGTAYRERRRNPQFASAWHAALLEGYEHLEMETLHRLRMGVSKDEPKFDTANSLRLLSLHRDLVSRERASEPERDEEAIFAAIDAKIEKMRARERNVARLLDDQGIHAPHLPGGNE